MVTCESYHWEEEFDASKDSTLHILKPCSDLFDKMKLVYSSREGDFTDQSGRLICFDPSAYRNCKSVLLIRKNNLQQYLQENNLQILWTVLGEKNIVGGWAERKADNAGMQDINGVYYLNEDTVEGDVSSRIR
jgi:hypothetical protein